MTKLIWDQVGERTYETGVDHGVLYLPNETGAYDRGYVWNGLVSVSESPSGAEPSPQYADNIKYLNLLSTEEFGATIEAFTYPVEFELCDGTAKPAVGLSVGQQPRKSFGFAYRTRIGNDIDGTDKGYKIHLVYGALAAPTEKSYSTINESPEALTFSWEISTTPVEVPGFKPSAKLTIDSVTTPPAKLAEIEAILYGSSGIDPKLPTPTELVALFAGSTVIATPIQPTYVLATKTITIPAVTGVIYQIKGVTKPAGAVVIAANTIVKAIPATGYKFPDVVDDDWMFSIT